MPVYLLTASKYRIHSDSHFFFTPCHSCNFSPDGSAGCSAGKADGSDVPLLTGYRGRPALDIEALAQVLSRVSWLITDHADRISEIDINPLFLREHGIVAADALIALKPAG